jgi:autotransporter passenger strand-loop-strand repeat protein
MSANEVSVVDIIPQADSGETNDNSEPSIAVNPANPLQFVAAGFGPHTHSPYFVSINGGTTWSDFGVLLDSDKSIAWVPDGSAVLTATLFNDSQINLYSATQSEVMSGGDFGSTINNFVGSNDNDQPWIRISPDGQIYTAYNNDGNDSPGNGESASINVSTDGGASYQQVISLDHVGGGSQDDPAVRHAVSGTTTYAIFDRWNTRIEKDAYGERHDAQLVIDKSLIGGADDFTALGAGGNGTQVGADHINVFTRAFNTQLSVGLNRIAGGDIAIAVDPNNVNHVVVAYTNGPGFDGAGVVQLIVAESEDGGNTWAQKYTTSETARSSQPALAILADGMIGFLYDAYDSTTNELSQHFVTTSNDFASTNDITLATETNNAFATFTENPYLGDFFDLTSLGNTFYGIFSALNFDNGDPTSGAAFTNVSFQRDTTGTPGTSSFQLTNSGRAVSESVDPFAFTLSGAGTTTQFVSSGVVSSGVSVGSANVLEVLSGGTASAIRVGSSGTEQVDQGGNASTTVISSGGIEVVYGSESGAALAGGTLEVISGGVVRGATVSSGGTLEIWSSGTAISTTVLSGGTLEYFDGAIASGTTLSAGATIEAGSGYVASGLAISSSLTLVVGADGSAVNNAVLSGGALTVSFGGTTSGSFVSSGGIESVSFLGSALGTTIGSGASQDITSGGLASGTLVDAGGSEVVGPFGSAVDATVSNGGSLIVSSGGSLELVGNDTLSGVTLLPGAILLVGSGYTLSGYVVSSGITLGVLSGGTGSNTTVQSGGAFEYFIDGAAGSPVLNSGAVRIFGSGISSGGTVDASSPLEVALGGEASGVSISSGGVESVLAGGSDADAEVGSRGTEIVYSGGTVTNDQIDPGGLLILSAGFASGVSLDGSESVLTGGVDTGSTIDANGSATVRSGGLVMGETLNGVLSLSGGLAVSTTIQSGGVENVVSGGLDSVGTISSGASEFVSSGGVASSATIDSGGLLGLFRGTAVWMTISSGGSVIVSSGSFDSAALISVGGAEVVGSGGTVSGATLSGRMLTLSGGTAIDTTINTAAEEMGAGPIATFHSCNSTGYAASIMIADAVR